MTMFTCRAESDGGVGVRAAVGSGADTGRTDAGYANHDPLPHPGSPPVPPSQEPQCLMGRQVTSSPAANRAGPSLCVTRTVGTSAALLASLPPGSSPPTGPRGPCQPAAETCLRDTNPGSPWGHTPPGSLLWGQATSSL